LVFAFLATAPFRGGQQHHVINKVGIQMMKAEQIRPEMIRVCEDVCEVLQLSRATAGVLLRQVHWNKESLLEQYISSEDNNERLLKQAGVYNRCYGGNDNSTKKTNTIIPSCSVAPGSKFTCPICYDETTDTLSMPCGHSFCRDCWSDFCSNAINEGPSCVTVTCPQAGCPEVVTEEEMEAVLGNDCSSLILQKYFSYQLRSFVESNPLTRWCPGRGCERVACALSPAAMESEGSVARCIDCYTDFCLVCGEEPHAPSNCKLLAKWLHKCRNESETANWIIANTKSCPKCSSRIEKNQGCNHMSCQQCRFEFCWICMGDWHDHGANTGGYYKCNRYDNNTDNTSDQSDAARAKRDLDRYLHYYKRFHAHQEAQKFAKKQLKDTEERMELFQQANSASRWTDVEFLKAATDQLIECRRVLKYTYVFAYYLDSTTYTSMQRDRFEHHQEMLEKFTEKLSELSEKQLPDMDRTDVVNQTRVVDRFVKSILKYVEDGMEDA
jgi:ariadne-1